jgi:hypothetical protein
MSASGPRRPIKVVTINGSGLGINGNYTGDVFIYGANNGASITLSPTAGSSHDWGLFANYGSPGLGGIANGSFSIADVSLDAQRFVITGAGLIGIGTTLPQATLDVNGYTRLAKNSSQPAACSATNDGAIALTHVYTLCICNGGSTSWIQSKDGSTACSW